MKIQWKLKTLLCVTFLFAVLLALDQLAESNSRSFQDAVCNTSAAGESDILSFNEEPTATFQNVKAHPVASSLLDRLLFRRRCRVSYTAKVTTEEAMAVVTKEGTPVNSYSRMTEYHYLSSDFKTGVFGSVEVAQTNSWENVTDSLQ